VASRFVAADIAGKLTSEYIATVYNTHGLSKEVTKSLNELYSTTAAQVEKYIGEPFEIVGTGTISYPFVVLRHANGKKNVILVAPGP
jgi:acetylglutamate kinase